MLLNNFLGEGAVVPLVDLLHSSEAEAEIEGVVVADSRGFGADKGPSERRPFTGCRCIDSWLGRSGAKETNGTPASTARFQPSSKRPSRLAQKPPLPVATICRQSQPVGTKFWRRVAELLARLLHRHRVTTEMCVGRRSVGNGRQLRQPHWLVITVVYPLWSG